MGTFDQALLIAIVLAATPLVFAAFGELVSERAGVLNVGLEGMMIVGAFFGFLTAERTGSWLLGAAGGTTAGMAFAAIAALLAIHARADQIVVGIGLNLLGLSLTAFLFTEVFESGNRIILDRPPRIAIPGLSALPGIGSAFFDQQLFVYAAGAFVVAVALLLTRSGWGISLRAAGEAPAAADAAGVSVVRTRWAGALVAGAGAGLGGAFLSLAQVGAFTQNMTAGRGFLALAAVIFGRWRPLGVLGACVLFGTADALQFRLQARGDVPREIWVAFAVLAAALLVLLVRRATREGSWSRRTPAIVVTAACVVGALGLAIVEPDLSLPPQLWLTLPYVLSLVVLGGFVGKARMPTALATPFVRTARAGRI